MTRTGRHLWVSVYFTIDGEMLNLEKLRLATEQVDARIGADFENCSCELISMPPEMPVHDTAEALEEAEADESD